MKLDRLLGIITILLQKEKVSAPELATRFEVSRRTIYRDIEDICKAGIPIITYQGGKGGISIAEGFKLDKSVLTREELQSILTGLKSLGSVTDTSRIEGLIAKLSPGKEAVISLRDSILIDLASHYKTSLSQKINLLKQAIAENRAAGFDYYSQRGCTRRAIEPYYIVFKWTAWYVFGRCRLRHEFRLFKLNRLWNLELTNQTFQPEEISAETLALNRYFTDENRVVILFDKSVEYHLIEDYGPNSYEETTEGQLKFSVGYTNRDYIIAWILGFGAKAKVIEPKMLADIIKKEAKKLCQHYEPDSQLSC